MKLMAVPSAQYLKWLASMRRGGIVVQMPDEHGGLASRDHFTREFVHSERYDHAEWEPDSGF